MRAILQSTQTPSFDGIRHISVLPDAFPQQSSCPNMYAPMCIQSTFLLSETWQKSIHIAICILNPSLPSALARPYWLKWGIPEWDIWSLGVMDQGSCQIGRVVGTPPPSPPPSPGSSGWHSGRGTMFGVFKLEFDTYESYRDFDTRVLHRISSQIYLA